MGIPTRVAESLFAEPIYLDVRKYVPVGEQLTQTNFQDALEAAYADALAKSDTIAVPPFIGAQLSHYPRYQVLVPEGLWYLTRTIVIPSRPQANPQKLTPGITGSSKYSTGFFIDTNNFTASGNAIFKIGGDNGEDYVRHLLLEKFNVQIHGGVSTQRLNMFDVTISFQLEICDVDIFGLMDSSGNPDYGWAIWLHNTGISANTQYPRLRNVRIQGCSGGVKASGCLPLVMEDVFCKQNGAYDYVLNGSVVYSTGGSTESGNPGTSSALHNSKAIPRVLTGWDTQVATGTGAAIGTASGDITTVTSLSGITAGDVGRWLYLEKSTSAYDGSDKVSGYYLILERVSATSVKIRKGSTHLATSSLIWKTCETGEVDLNITGFNYREGDCFALIGYYATTGGAGSLCIGSVDPANCDFVAEALGSSARSAPSIVIDNVALQTTYLLKARFASSIVALSATEASIGDLDEYSREGLVYRGRSLTYSGETSFSALSAPGPVRTSLFPGGSARTMCKLGGAIALWDARVASSFNKSGADITSWTDSINGIVAGLINVGKFPQYSASDVTFNNLPSVAFTGGIAADTCGLSATIPSALFGTTHGLPCMVAVMTTKTAIAFAADTSCRLRLLSGASVADMSVFLLENNSAVYGAGIYPPGDTQNLAMAAAAAAHVFIMGGGGRSAPRISAEADNHRMGNYVNSGTVDQDEWAPADAVLYMQPKDIYSNTGTLYASFIAVFPHGLSPDARDQLLDQLCLEFGISRN